jgi:hypothetical protein
MMERLWFKYALRANIETMIQCRTIADARH